MIKYFHLIHRWSLTCATTPSQSGPESNGNKGVLYIPFSLRTKASPSDAVYFYTQDTSSSIQVLGGTGSNGNKGVLDIFQSSRSGASLSEGLGSYQGHLLGIGSYTLAVIQFACSTAPGDWICVCAHIYTTSLNKEKNWFCGILSGVLLI